MFGNGIPIHVVNGIPSHSDAHQPPRRVGDRPEKGDRLELVADGKKHQPRQNNKHCDDQYRTQVLTNDCPHYSLRPLKRNAGLLTLPSSRNQRSCLQRQHCRALSLFQPSLLRLEIIIGNPNPRYAFCQRCALTNHKLNDKANVRVNFRRASTNDARSTSASGIPRCESKRCQRTQSFFGS